MGFLTHTQAVIKITIQSRRGLHPGANMEQGLAQSQTSFLQARIPLISVGKCPFSEARTSHPIPLGGSPSRVLREETTRTSGRSNSLELIPDVLERVSGWLARLMILMASSKNLPPTDPISGIRLGLWSLIITDNTSSMATKGTTDKFSEMCPAGQQVSISRRSGIPGSLPTEAVYIHIGKKETLHT